MREGWKFFVVLLTAFAQAAAILSTGLAVYLIEQGSFNVVLVLMLVLMVPFLAGFSLAGAQVIGRNSVNVKVCGRGRRGRVR